MAFPGPGAQVHYNEAGEPLGWDYPSDEPPEMDDDDYERRFGARDAQAEEEYEDGYQHGQADAEEGWGRKDPEGNSKSFDDGYNSGYTDNMAPILYAIHASLQEMRHDLAADPPIDRKRGEE